MLCRRVKPIISNMITVDLEVDEKPNSKYESQMCIINLV